MPGLYSHTTRASGTVLTAAIYNTDHQNHIDNQTAQMTDDYSGSVSQMQSMRDPYPGSAESLATSLAEELESIRYQIKGILGGAVTQWYQDSPSSLSEVLDGNWKTVTKDNQNYSILSTDCVVFMNLSGGVGKTATLPATTGTANKIYAIYKKDGTAAVVTIAPTGADTISGDASYSLSYQYEGVVLKAKTDGTGWVVLGGYIHSPVITSFSAAQHNHNSAAGGGGISNFTSSQHNHSNAAGGGDLSPADNSVVVNALSRDEDWFLDDFNSGVSVDNQKWYIVGGPHNQYNSAVRLDGTTVNPGSISSFSPGVTTGAWLITATNNIIFETRVKLDINQPDNSSWGLCNATGIAPGTTSSSLRFYQTAAGGHTIHCVTQKAGVSSDTDTGLLLSTTYKKFKIEANSSQVLYYIDGVLVATHNTNIPLSNMGVALPISDAGAHYKFVDYIYCYSSERIV